MQPFVPVLLGSDINVYGIARSFHEVYGIPSAAIGKGRLGATANSRIVTVEVAEPRLEEDAVFVDTLLRFAARYPAETALLLIPCGDNYTRLLVRNQAQLRTRYRFACMEEALLDKLSTKDGFYRLCDAHGFAYPRTDTLTADNYAAYIPPFEFPIVIKPADSVAYWNCHFPHKKKVFVAQTQAELTAILAAIYGSSYQEPLILQEYIPGDDSHMRVLNAFCGRDGRVRLLALGQVLLEEHSPEGIGSYAAIIPTVDRALTERFRVFLEAVGYVGFANFDLKFDARDGQYKVFEINPRQGRSSFVVTAAGYNLAQYLAEDVLEESPPVEPVIATNEVLWTIIPRRVLLRYLANDTLKAQARRLMREGKVCRSLWYPPDMNLRRRWYFWQNQMSYRQKYKRYFGNKSLRD